jgi:voltage-gated potassium channel
MDKIKKKVYAIVEVVSHEDLVTRKFDVFDIFIIVLIVLNIFAVILETVKGIYDSIPQLFRYFEIFSVIVFTIEYVLRVWTCTINQKYKNPIAGRIKFVLSPLALVDLFAFLPFYVPMIIPFDLRFLRAFRLLRLIRVLKIGRYSEAVKLFGRVLNSKKTELFTAIFVIFVLLIISSSLLYYVEHGAQPDKFSSIPEAMWWGVVTLTTVGYGDIYPITPFGKFFASIISLLGIGLFAMPAGILSAGFVEEIKAKKLIKDKCPHCGADLND